VAEKAIAESARATAGGVEEPGARETLGRVEMLLGRPREAARELERAVASQPNSVDARFALASAYVQLDRAAEAEAVYRRAVELQPGWWGTHSHLGVFLLTQGRVAESLPSLREAIRLSPDNTRAIGNLGIAYQQLGLYEEAIAEYRRSIAIRPTAAALSNLGSCEFVLGRYAEAAQSFERALALQSSHALLWRNLGDALRWAGGREAEALAAYRRPWSCSSRISRSLRATPSGGSSWRWPSAGPGAARTRAATSTGRSRWRRATASSSTRRRSSACRRTRPTRRSTSWRARSPPATRSRRCAATSSSHPCARPPASSRCSPFRRQTEDRGGPGRQGGKMTRVASGTAALVWAALVSCQTAAAQPPATPAPPCEAVGGRSVTIAVDREAVVDKACVEIRQGRTDVVWQGAADVKELRIVFKAGATAPPDAPSCAGSTCTLEKAKHAAKKGVFDYAVLVVRQDGSQVEVDPRLIIQP